jgi:hypothetical protein
MRSKFHHSRIERGAISMLGQELGQARSLGLNYQQFQLRRFRMWRIRSPLSGGVKS